MRAEVLKISTPCNCSPHHSGFDPRARSRSSAAMRKLASPREGSNTVSVGLLTAQSQRYRAISGGAKNASRAFRFSLLSTQPLLADSSVPVDPDLDRLTECGQPLSTVFILCSKDRHCAKSVLGRPLIKAGASTRSILLVPMESERLHQPRQLTSAPCRPSRIASMRSGLSCVRRSTRVMQEAAIPSR